MGGLGAQFVMSQSDHLVGTKAFFMPIQSYFRQSLNHFVIES